jgi:hypothetical protein
MKTADGRAADPAANRRGAVLNPAAVPEDLNSAGAVLMSGSATRQ